MNDLTLFLAGSAAIVWLSRKPLRKPGSHGFYRFFAWEAILGLIVLNREVWGSDPYSPHQFASWLLMMTSVALVVIGVATLKRDGAPGATRDDGSFYEFEKTTQLVSHGIFGYSRWQHNDFLRIFFFIACCNLICIVPRSIITHN